MGLYPGLNGNIVRCFRCVDRKKLLGGDDEKFDLAFGACVSADGRAGGGPGLGLSGSSAGIAAPDPSKVVKVPGSDKQYTEAQVNDAFAPPDWFPGDHAPLPSVVANGVKPAVRACALCHLTTGDGHPESASLAGLNAPYIMRALRDFASGKRKGIRTGVMVGIAKDISPDDARAAADYFSARKQGEGYIKVVEKAEVPEDRSGRGRHALRRPGRRRRADRQSHHRGAAGRGRGPGAQSAHRIRRLCAARQHRQGRELGHDRRRRQDRPLRHLSRRRV